MKIVKEKLGESSPCPLLYYHIFYVGTPSGVHLFDHLLWPIFQSSIFYTLHYTIVFKFLQILVYPYPACLVQLYSSYIHAMYKAGILFLLIFGTLQFSIFNFRLNFVETSRKFFLQKINLEFSEHRKFSIKSN